MQNIPFNINNLLDIAETKGDLLASIKLLKGRLDHSGSLLSENRLHYTRTLHRLKNKLIVVLSQCNRNTLRINNKIPRAEDRISLHDSTLIPDEYDDFITDGASGAEITMNTFLTNTREKANQARAEFKAQTTQLHHAFTTIIKDTQQSIGDINSQITELNTALEQQQSCAKEVLHLVDSNHSYQKAIKNLKSILKQVKKQEKYNHNTAAALHLSPKQPATTENMATTHIADISEITATIKENQSLNTTTLHNRQPIIYALVKAENEAILITLTQNLGKDTISNEFKHDIIHVLAKLKATASERLSDIEIRNKLNEIMSVLYNASTTTPALINEGQYMALAQKLALAYSAKEPSLLALFNQAQEILRLNTSSSSLNSEKINTLIRYLTTDGQHEN